MQPRDFYNYKNEKGSAKDIQCHLLKSLWIIQFRKESIKIGVGGNKGIYNVIKRHKYFYFFIYLT